MIPLAFTIPTKPTRNKCEITRRSTYLRHLKLFLPISIFSAVFLTACGGGGVGGETAQEPDAVVQDLPIVYIRRPIPVDEDGQRLSLNLLEPATFNPGAELILRELASPSAAEFNISQLLFDNGIFNEGELIDIKDLAVSSDGTQLAFALRAPELEDADEDEQPTWNIWRYDLSSSTFNRVITSDLIAEQGQDIAPAFLPDGRIVFSSTRQQSNLSTLLDEGKPQYAAQEEDRDVDNFVLHTVDEEGNNVRQITFNQSHDLDPHVLTDGRIVFSRWDNMGNRNNINLYTVNPDGRNLQILYGNHSHQTGTNGNRIEFVNPQELPNGRLMVQTRDREISKLSGDLTSIDVTNFTDNNVAIITGPTTENAQVSLTAENVSNDESQISEGGYYNSAFPLWDGTDRILVSWSLCRLLETDAQGVDQIVACTEDRLADNPVEADPQFGIWMLNLQEDTILPIETGDDGLVYSEAVAMQSKPVASFISDGIPGVDLDQGLVDEKVGVVHIRSVYDLDGVDTTPLGIDNMADPVTTPVATRPARFLRLVKAVSIPNDDLVDLDGSAFGRSQNQLMREILGYVPIEPDGSVKFKVPADVAFAISILDANGRRITGRHQNWLQVKAGEEMQCMGCHTGNSELPHGRFDAQPDSINFGATATGVAFPNTEPALSPDAGETMAEVWARINGPRTPTVDLVFEDDWTDPAVQAKEPAFIREYRDLLTLAPSPIGCQDDWNSLCRITINYIDHIQPLWDLPRVTFDIDGITVLSDNTCIACHSNSDSMNMTQIPAAQLELVNTPSTDDPDLLTSYRELFFNDNEQEIMNGALIDVLVPLLDGNGDPVYEVDEDGELILDANGDPIPVFVNVNIGPALSSNGAVSSRRLFDRFLAGGSHAGYLSDAELKLLAEWLDIGAQYYNNPFDVPQN